MKGVNLKPIDMLRTMAIIAGHVWYIATAWRDVNEYNNFGIVLFGQVILTGALILSIMDNIGYAPKFRGVIRDSLLRFFNWVEGR